MKRIWLVSYKPNPVYHLLKKEIEGVDVEVFDENLDFEDSMAGSESKNPQVIISDDTCGEFQKGKMILIEYKEPAYFARQKNIPIFFFTRDSNPPDLDLDAIKSLMSD